MKRVLLVEPAFPIPTKSRNHHNFLPIGLLKIASYLASIGVDVKLIRGVPSQLDQIAEVTQFSPDEVWITSLFTYWAGFVKETVQSYRAIVPHAKIVVGGIYASLRPAEEVRQYTECDEVYQGVMLEAEGASPAYHLLVNHNPIPIDYQIVHASRGCKRKCRFCGTWMIEPEFKPLKSIKEQIQFKKVVFYDNNLLMNPHIEDILQELAELRADRKIVWCESQSGFDGRLLLRKPRVASMLKRAGFRNPRIAWDHGEADHSAIHEQLQILRAAGYDLSKETFIFMVYNWETPFKAMEAKRIRCWKWGVQIADCRFRPLDQLYDRYRGSAFQGPQDYYIHTSGGWTDALVKQFRRNVREQNICVRHGFSFYSRRLERKGRQASGGRVMPVGRQIRTLARDGADCWVPRRVRFPLARATASRK